MKYDYTLTCRPSCTMAKRDFFRSGAGLFVVLGFLVSACIMMSCNLWPRDDPADPEGKNYQGFPTVESADKIVAVSPQDGVVLGGAPAEFVVSQVAGAEAYWLQVSETADFAGTLVVDKADYSTNKLAVAAGIIESEGTFYWRVKAKQGGVWGSGWTGVQKFEVFRLLRMVNVPGGSFQMGKSGIATPVHTVNLTGFLMSKYEVTQEQYQMVTGSSPSHFSGTNLPVESVTWHDAVEFCNTLSEREGLQKVYTITAAMVTMDMTRNGYRLPTEAEWEYAARGGDGSPGNYIYAGSNDISEVAWWGYGYGGNSGYTTNPVGIKKANGLGLHDMTGNVFEWCWDWFGAYNSSTQNDPTGTSSGSYRVNRGGSWYNSADGCRVAIRINSAPDYRYDNVGFRPVRRP